jgi:23S rRNA pseudouridine1911/1915/1917 synthase
LYDATEDLSLFLTSAFADSGFAPHLCPRRIFLKWPNDLVTISPGLLNSLAKPSGSPSNHDPGTSALAAPEGSVGKLAGTLIEAALGTHSQGGWVVIGMGVNLLEAPTVALSDKGNITLPSNQLTLPQRPQTIVDALCNLIDEEPTGDAKARQRRRQLERWRKEPRNRILVIERFAEALQREVLEYLTVPRTVGQLKSLALARALPTGTSLTTGEQHQSGNFVGLGDDGALLLDGMEPIYAGDVSLRLARIQNPSTRQARENLHAKKRGGQQEPTRHHAPTTTTETDEASSHGAAPQPRHAELLIDIGNTRTHWAYAPANHGLDHNLAAWELGHLPHATLEQSARKALNDEGIRALFSAVQGERRSSMRIVAFSVKDSQTTKRILDTLSGCLELCYPEMRLDVATMGIDWVRLHSPGVHRVLESYGSTMGIDRALRLDLALHEADSIGKPVGVLSLGTATTIEVVGPTLDPDNSEFSDSGPFQDKSPLLDSRILPGIQMSFESLAKGTAHLPELEYNSLTEHDLTLDRDNGTRGSLARGIILGTAEVCQTICQRFGVEKLWICGGSAAHFAALGLIHSFAKATHCTVELAENLGLEALRRMRARVLAIAPHSGASTQTADRPFRPILGHAIASAPDLRAGLGEHGRRVAETLFKGRRYYRNLAAAGPSPSADQADNTDDVTELPIEDFRCLGPRIETSFVGERLDRHLGQRFRFHSRGDWQSRILRNEVLVEHGASRVRSDPEQGQLHPIKPTYRLRPFDQLWLYQPQEHEPGHIRKVQILKDTGDEIAFHKPGNLVVHATGLYGRNTFLDVIANLGHQNVFPVHRIDRETSGILLCARNSATRRHLADLFRDGCMQKMYLAVVQSFAETPRDFVVDAPIGPALGSPIRLKMWVGEHTAAQPAQTHFVRLAQVGRHSLFACIPLTGRTNQIRVHLAAAGQWILGDKMYHPNENLFLNYFEHGLRDDVLRVAQIPRQALHNAAIMGSGSSAAIFNDGPIICPLSEDLMELRLVRDLLEVGGLGLTETSQMDSISKLFQDYNLDQVKARESCAIWGVAELREPTRLAQTACAGVIAPP